MQKSDELLRQLIREMISEDDTGGLMDAGYDMNNGFGAHYASSNQMYDTFVKPFVDVADVAGGKTKEMSKKTGTLMKVAFETIATTLIPFLNDSYDEIFKDESEALDKIKNEYADVYNATWDAFKDNDIATMAFMYNPGSCLTSLLARKAPGVTGKLLSVLSGGSLDGFLDKVKDKFGRKGSAPPDRSSGGNTDSWQDEHKWLKGTLLREDDEKQSAGDVLTNKKVIDKALATPTAQHMQRDAVNVVRNTLKKVYAQAQAIMSAKDIGDLQTKLGKKFPGFDKLQQVPQQERAQAEQQLLTTTKKSMKAFYVKNLKSQIDKAMKAGIPQNSSFVRDYMSVISKINAL